MHGNACILALLLRSWKASSRATSWLIRSDPASAGGVARLPRLVYCRLGRGAAPLLDGIQLSTFSWAALHSHA